jgi:xylulose-5-phosphate/fructose-6-phosphate phosphoketolase
MVDKRAVHRAHTRRTGEDLSEVSDWTWPAA